MFSFDRQNVVKGTWSNYQEVLALCVAVTDTGKQKSSDSILYPKNKMLK